METNEELKKTWKDFVPRKIAGGLIAMLLIAQAASELKDAAKWQFGLTICCMSLLGIMAIWSHYLLERGPKPKRKQNTENRTQNEYHPDIPDEEQKPVA